MRTSAAEADRRSVESANASFYSAVEHGDLDLLGTLWLDGALGDQVVCVHPGWSPLHGRSRVLRSFAAVMAGTPYIQFFLTDVDVRLCGDVAVLTCAENILTGIEADGADDGLSGGAVTATNVFRRTAGGWRLWVHHASPVLGVVPEDGSDRDAADGEGRP